MHAETCSLTRQNHAGDLSIMVLQNEALDDEDEHFEDVVKETITKEDHGDISTDEHNEKVDHESDSSSDEEEDNAVASSSEDDDSDDDQQLMREDHSQEVTLEQKPIDEKAEACSAKSSLPGGYDPRHREPSYCNADRASWWELRVLASHAHPSVATMAGTLLSGANIVYNGNPLNDLSLSAFLDKFMEKKAKQKEWHGGSQIEPAKKLDMDNNMIGPEIVWLAEEDVAPEDVVFHKFYTNKMNSTNSKKKQKKKKKKTADEEDAEELFDAGDGGADDDVGGVDESDNEEIDNLLDATLEEDHDGEYDYDDLDRIADEDEDELVADLSDTEIGAFSDIGEESDIEVGDVDDGDDDEVAVDTKKRKRAKKIGGGKGASPFASFEEYEHLMEGEGEKEDGPSPKKDKKKKPKSRKKKQKTNKSSSD